MRLEIERTAMRRLLDLPPKARAAMTERLKAIAADPFAMHPNVKSLVGEKDVFRLRQGDWRAVYRIERIEDVVRVLVIEIRGKVYR